MDSRRRDVCGTELYVAEVVVDACRVRADVTISKILRDAIQLKQLDLIARSERGQILLITVKVDLKIFPGAIGGAVGKEWLPRGSVGNCQRDGHHRVTEWHRYIGVCTREQGRYERQR